jgi:hypothetical protein
VVGARVRKHLLCFLVPFLAANLALELNRRRVSPPSLTGFLEGKVRHYADHAADYDLVFVGDSRTYCAVHPDLLDPLLGSRSVNLAHWAHWFPTQLAFLEDIAPHVPPGATIVWSIGHQNFTAVPKDPVGTAYPIGLRNVPRYLAWGFRWSDLDDDVYRYDPLTQVVGRGGLYRGAIADWERRVVWRGSATPVAIEATVATPTSSSSSPTPPVAVDVEAELARLRADPGVVEVEVLYADDGHATSLAARRRGGSYYRVELDPAWFRAKQREGAPAPATGPAPPFEPHAAYWRTFEAALDLLRARGLRVVVNELEEAPHSYASLAQREAARAFMRERVRPAVEARGFRYVRVDLDRLEDAHYFDWNHLNSRGVAVYTPLLADALR